ncbi:MAG: GreA/GreB family elongation factor [Phenylobacterium sp.]
MHASTSHDPVVRMTPTDYVRLSSLPTPADSLGAAILEHELDRAVLVAADDALPAFVRLGTRVEYIDLLSGRTRTLQVVLPGEADIDSQRVSVSAPVGAALIGLAPGDSFGWTGENGRLHTILIVNVEDRHEDA